MTVDNTKPLIGKSDESDEKNIRIVNMVNMNILHE